MIKMLKRHFFLSHLHCVPLMDAGIEEIYKAKQQSTTSIGAAAPHGGGGSCQQEENQ